VSTPAETVRAARRQGARLGAHATWQLRDYLWDRGLPTFLISALFGYLGAAPIRALIARNVAHLPERVIARYGSVQAAQQALTHDASAAFLRSFLGSMVFLGALFAMNGIVANDRKLGYYRFLFSKPMTPPRYYGQAFMLSSAGYFLIMAVLALVYGAFIEPLLSPSFMAAIALVFLCYAGIGFALSAAARWDWLSLVAVTVATTVLRGRFGESTNSLAKLLYLLPPLHKTDEVYTAVSEGLALPWHALAWLGGYGAVCVLIGLGVLRYRRLAII
jgi:hypothetical protein